MKPACAVLVLFLCKQIAADDFVTKYIDVPVDHFSFATNATFKLKYLVNDTYWIDDGPIFFYTGNEGTIESFAQNTGFMYDIAPAFNALLVFAEHRYYGTSLPFGNLSYTSPTYLGYLTSTQALADYVYLIESLQKTYSTSEYLDELPVVAFGGSYGGMLASWLRMKYPSSVVGAIAASAPIWQFQGLTPCENFNRIVTDVYKVSLDDDDCSVPIQTSWNIIRNYASTDAGKAWLSKEWKLCKPLKTTDDVNTLVNWWDEIIVNMAMVNYPYPSSFLVPLPAQPVKAFCDVLTNNVTSSNGTPEDLLSSIATALEVYTNYTKTAKCNDIAVTSPDLGESGWDFQACTEMIMPFCSTDEDMFENYAWNFDEFAATCYKKWNVNQPKAELPILEYGGKNLEAASNIVFSNGLLDPWSSGGVLSNVSSTVSAIVIPEGAHHLDLRTENLLDPRSVIEARKFHVRSISKWVSDYYSLRHNKLYKKLTHYEKIEYLHSNQL